MLDAYEASNTKFSALDCAVRSSVPNSIFDPEDRSLPLESTEPERILRVIDDKSASTIPSNVIDPDVPELSGAKYIVVLLSIVEVTISTPEDANESKEDFPNPLGTEAA